MQPLQSKELFGNFYGS